jgi:hypothetical protein
MDYTVFVPYIISILLTLVYASLGKLSSGEPFDITKFAETFAVQITALIGFALATFIGNIDLTSLVVALPTVITALIMKLYSIIKQRQTVVTPT